MYAYALYSVDDAVVVGAAANSEQAFERCRSRLLADQSRCSWLESREIRLVDCLLGECRWNAFEWEYGDSNSEPFESVCALLGNRGSGAYAEREPEGFIEQKAGVFAAMVLALSDLAAEGFFGAEQARASITLFCTVADSNCAIWLEDDSTRRLNPPAVYQSFAEQRMQWIDDRANGDGHNEIHRAYLRQLGDRSTLTLPSAHSSGAQ